MHKNLLVLGLTGPNAAGKSEVCKYLVSKGFYSTSLSDILREIAKKEKILPIRENLIKLGNQLRQKYGSGVLAKRLCAKIKKSRYNKIVVDSIRNIGEIKELRKNFKNRFFLIYITAPKKLRFKFLLKRARQGDPKTYKEFLEVEKKEISNKSTHQQLHKCKELRDFMINNESTLNELYKKIDEILEKIEKRL